VLAGLIDGLREADGDAEVRAIVLTGAGERVFCAGADLASGMTSDTDAVEQHDQRGLLRDLLTVTEDLGKPLIGRLNGHALAGGLGVALACDLLVAADDVELGTPEVRVGLWPYMISALLVEHLGPKRALELMMTGDRISAVEARDWGLVNRVCPRDRLDETVGS
jgi:enoyl-CoA hydratase